MGSRQGREENDTHLHDPLAYVRTKSQVGITRLEKQVHIDEEVPLFTPSGSQDMNRRMKCLKGGLLLNLHFVSQKRIPLPEETSTASHDLVESPPMPQGLSSKPETTETDTAPLVTSMRSSTAATPIA